MDMPEQEVNEPLIPDPLELAPAASVRAEE
jgi:hypothetical protein